MTKTLIIAEKPSVARDIAAALGGFSRTQEWLESPTAIVTSAIGHLVELHVPEAAVAGAPLPLIPSRFGLQPIEKTKSQFSLVKKLLSRQDVASVVNACDAGREGELIFRLVYEHAGSRKPMRRMWLQSMTAESIREAFRNMRPGQEFDALAAAARSRAEADWLIGINGSRAISRQRGEPSSAGRVQTPTLAMIVERHLAIVNFKASDYFEVHARFGVQAGAYIGRWQNPSPAPGEPADRLADRAAADAIAQACRGQLVQDVQEESKSVQRAAPRLYDLTSLQRDANKRLGLSAKQTLEIAQSLYERHKVLTYPRTDSNALPEDYVDQAKATMRAIAQGGHQVHQAHAKRVLDEGWIQPAKRIFDNSKISDHFAIVPTGTPAQGLSDIEAQIFDMVARRFIAAFNPAAEYLSTTRLTAVAGHRFKSTGRVLTQPGWMSVYGQDLAEEDGDEKEPALCAYRPGESVRNEAVEAKALKTKPPKPFTEASLLSAMETAGKLVEDDELAAAMKERGLGTPATRAAIIEGLLSDGGGKKEPYLRREKKNLVPTPKAISLIGFLREQGIEQLTSPAMTGDWEHQLRQVEAGRMQRASFMAEIERLTREVVATVMEHAAAEAPPQTLSCPCPRCGGQVVATSRTVDCAQACGFRLWRAIAKRSMSIEELQVLVTTRSLPPLEGFISSKTGKPFSAGLALDAEHRATFVFQERSGALPGTPGAGAVPGGPKLDWACPACGKKSLMRNGRVIECSCGQFKLWTMVAKKQLTDTQLATLINRGAVAAKGLTSSKGSKFDATLKLDRTGKVSFDFS